MNLKVDFRAQAPWGAERPETLVVCCSDGRWHSQIEEFVQHQVSTRADMYVIPGGPGGLSLWSSSFEESRGIEKAFHFLAKHHNLKSVWLIGHQSCAYYVTKYSSTRDENFIFRRQLEDLERARRTISNWKDDLVIKKVFASLDKGRVVFSLVD
jgi:carbonic anhydrase